MLAIKNALTEMKNALDGLIGRVNIVEETISELGDRSTVTKLKCKKKKE